MNNHPKTLKRNLYFPDQDEHPEILLEEKLKEMDMIIKGFNIFLEQT